MKKTLTITVTIANETTEAVADSGKYPLSGDELLDGAARAIASAVQIVEKTWLAAGYSQASANDAGQRAINRAARLLNLGVDIAEGSIEARTK